MGIVRTISWQNSRLRRVRSDLAEVRKGSSYAKHCKLLRPLLAGNASWNLPRPGTSFKSFTIDAMVK